MEMKMPRMIEAVVRDNADNLMNAFYWIGQTLIAEDDGGIAEGFEGGQDFQGGLATDILTSVAEKVGADAVRQRGADLFDTASIMGGVDPLVPDMEDIDEGVVEHATLLTADLFLKNVYRVFPEMGDTGLEGYASEIKRVAGNYIRSEWSFTNSYPGGYAR